jgi:hypothetical protein
VIEMFLRARSEPAGQLQRCSPCGPRAAGQICFLPRLCQDLAIFLGPDHLWFLLRFAQRVTLVWPFQFLAEISDSL